MKALYYMIHMMINSDFGIDTYLGIQSDKCLICLRIICLDMLMSLLNVFIIIHWNEFFIYVCNFFIRSCC